MKKEKKYANRSQIVLLQLVTLIIGIVFAFTIIVPILAIFMIFIEGLFLKKVYICPECGNEVTKTSKVCPVCDAKFT